MKVVIRIGGSIIASPPNPKLICEYADLLRGLRAQGHEIVVVVGGGSIARDFISLAREVGLNEQEQDEIAISISRVFAQLLAIKLVGLESKHISTSLRDAAGLLETRGIVIMGGLRPGMTTDAVAALIASKVNADLIVKATDQEGIYTKDPKRYPDAEKIHEIGFGDLFNLLEEERHKAGIHQILDPEAVRILQKKQIKTIIINGFNPKNITRAINGEKIGTIIQ